MRLAFLGTPAPAVVTLEALIEAGHEIALVVTQPDRKRGRGGALVPSPVAAAARDAGIPVTSKVDDVLDTDVELGVVVAFGKLIKPHVLDRLPMVNVHFSLLPRWRGAAPVERAILAGDTETGVCLMALDEGLDTGPVYDCRPLAVGSEDTADELRVRLAAAGTEMLLDRLLEGLGAAHPQVGEPTYAHKVDPAELHLDWSQPAEQLHRVVRLGRAWTTVGGRRLIIREARQAEPPEVGAPAGSLVDSIVVCGGGGGLQLLVVQSEGHRAQPFPEWRKGVRSTAVAPLVFGE